MTEGKTDLQLKEEEKEEGIYNYDLEDSFQQFSK